MANSDPYARPVPWKVEEYDESGGYDCMTGAWRIVDAKGHTVVVVDCATYGQRMNESSQLAVTRAGIVARLIVEGVNYAMRQV